MQKIFLAADHAGFLMKESIKVMLGGEGFDVVDCGAEVLTPGDDYPAFMQEAAMGVARTPGARAILFGGSGQGEAIVANRIPGVRAAVYYGGPEDIVRLSREHNDANALSIGARFIGPEEAKKIITLWLKTDFSNDERHARRIRQIDSL